MISNVPLPTDNSAPNRLATHTSINNLGGWRDGSAVKSTDYSSKGTEFKFQPPHGASEPSVRRSDTRFWTA
jgi:hypothetical protein